MGCLLALLPHRRAALDASILGLPWRENGIVLEIGCGNGDRLALLQELGWKILGIEPDDASAAIARTRGIEILNRPFGSGLLNAASVDAILLCHVIEHLSQPEEALKECYRLLKPGGVLIILTPNTQSLGYQKFGKNWLHLDPPRHLNLFNQKNLNGLLTKSGFSNPACCSTLRDANWTLGGSLALKKRNTYKIGSLPFLERLMGLILLYDEWAALKKNPFCGEDLICEAQKAGNQ
jgi:SAM-dependent methyltransferase